MDENLPVDLGALANSGAFDFSIWTIMAGLVFSVVGLYYFRAGKRATNIPVVITGIALMLYPYFVTNPWACWAVGVGLTFYAYRTLNA
jgi:hypothetical protein